MSFDISEELKKLPDSPGVYIMHDASGQIIYVGKAVNLKNRVRQYFQSDRNKSPKIRKMVPQIERFEYVITDSELEALILECNLIKEYAPKYNTLLKDDKSYPFIRVTTDEKFPRIVMARRVKKGKSKIFGPYSNAAAVKETIELLRKLFKIRPCNYSLSGARAPERACLYYHIHQCGAPCIGLVDEEEYSRGVEGALSFLNGNYNDILNELYAKMTDASEEMRFEEAASYRELIKSVKHIGENQKAAMGQGEDRDIIAVASEGGEAIAQIFFVRDGKLIGREHYHLKADPDETDGVIIQDFIKQFYSGTPFIPKEIMLSDDISETEIVEEWLSVKKGSKVRISVPKKGSKEKLVTLAGRNARLVLQQDMERLKNEEAATAGAVSRLGELLGINTPKRIEAYDISNISGFQSVGSMVVYENGVPKRADYRKFKIRSVKGPDDYASMKEVLMRRFKRALEQNSGFEELPDLILMDGGAGQVNICLKVLEEMGLDIPVAGMVKDDRHRTRGLYFNAEETGLAGETGCFNLITRIQDEVHRFAITYHRLLRSKGQIHSVLDDIPLIGETRKKELLRHFENTEQIKNASVEELESLPGMNSASAKAVYEFFNGGGEK
jgi:excinuclease ABC subunit C